MGDVMNEPAPVPPAPETDAAPGPRGLLQRPAVLAGLSLYVAALGALAVLLARSGPAPLPRAELPPYEVKAAWVSAVFPQLHRESPDYAKIRFRDRVDELLWRAGLYERQRCWKRARACYEEVSVLIRDDDHPVVQYVRERMKALVRLES
jgi:hypothetical protein